MQVNAVEFTNKLTALLRALAKKLDGVEGANVDTRRFDCRTPVGCTTEIAVRIQDRHIDNVIVKYIILGIEPLVDQRTRLYVWAEGDLEEVESLNEVTQVKHPMCTEELVTDAKALLAAWVRKHRNLVVKRSEPKKRAKPSRPTKPGCTRWECLQRKTGEQGKIQMYLLRNLDSGLEAWVNPITVKQNIQEGLITVSNLTLTVDNRLLLSKKQG